MKLFYKTMIRCLLAMTAALLLTGNPVHAEGEWYEDYEYTLNPSDGTIQLRNYIGAGGNIVVPGSATIEGVTYRTVLGGDYGKRTFYMKENLTGVEFLSGVSLISNCSGLFSGDKNLTHISFPADFNTSAVTDMSYLFQSCKALESLDLTTFNTSQVRDFTGMFEFCSSLSDIDLSGLDTSNAQSMRSMFEGCNALNALDVTGFQTGNVTDFSSMFSNCRGLKSIDVTGFQTSRAERMNSMFSGCTALETLDVHTFDTSHVTNMDIMFGSCSSLRELDLSNFNTENVVQMAQMFSSCQSLTSLDLSSFRTGNVTTMKGMFTNLLSMTTLDVSNFDTSHVTNTFGMFSGLRNESLDLSGFDMSKVTDMRTMFSNMSNLTTIDLSGFDMSAATMTENMFASCTNLVTIKTPAVKPSISTKIVGNTKFAEKDEAGYYRENRYTDFLDAPASTLIYRVDTYRITFNASGGNGTMDSIDAQCGIPVRLPLCTFTRDGYYFAGWSTTYAATSTAYEDGAEVMDLTRRNQTYNLYARWRRPASFSVTLPAMLKQTVEDGRYYNQTISLNVSFSGNTGDYLRITPTVTDLTDGKGVTIPTQVSISSDTYRNGGGVGTIWVRSLAPMKNLPAGDYHGTLTVTFQSVYN